jgi:hypothetical protein
LSFLGLAAAVTGGRIAELPLATAAATSSWGSYVTKCLLVEPEKTIEMRL